MGSLFVAVLIIIVLVSLFYKNTGNYEKDEREQETIRRLKTRYEDALRSGDKARAMTCGKDYYAYLRNSRSLSAADEQALKNDLEKMS